MDFEAFYLQRAAYFYLLCYRLESEPDKVERLFADAWKRIHLVLTAEESADRVEPEVQLARAVGEAHRTLGRLVGGEGAGDAADLQAAVWRLSPEYRLPIVLREVGELSYSATAAALDIPRGTVRSRVARARNLLRPQQASAVDDELVSAYIDAELDGKEAM